MSRSLCRRLLFPLVLLVVNGSLTHAQDMRVYAEGELPKDRRLGPMMDLDGYFPFEVPNSVSHWKSRKERLRKQVLLATGLWPELPRRTPMKPVVHGRVQRDGFTVEKVYFESVPNHFVTGLLFRPDDGKSGKRPAVLCPHGHGGRMQDYGADKMPELLASGAEKFAESGRFPKLARCVQLARMGCVVFIFDMLGYEDSQQISYDLAHRFKTQRPEMENSESWGFFSCQAESNLQSIMGVQTWNSIRCLDFLELLPDVDASRIAVTGGSGGGTQTILLCAIDDRPIAAFPNGMVSTSMQGGCTCENCSLLRIGTGNVELAALFAPKPQAMTAADDWTRNMMTRGYPSLKELYSILGEEQNVYCRPLLEFPHNYNYQSRATMYRWFNKHLRLDLIDIVEKDFVPLTKSEAAVWNDAHPQPGGGEAYERSLTKYLAEEAERQLQSLLPNSKAEFQRFNDTIGEAFRLIVGRKLPAAGKVSRVKGEKHELANYWLFTDRLRSEDEAEEFPIVSVYPKTNQWSGDVIIWLDAEGKSSMFDDNGSLSAEVEALVLSGAAVISPDLFQQGEFLRNGQKVSRQRKVKNPREAASYSFCYNDTLLAQRTHDCLALLSYVTNDEHAPQRVSIRAANGTGTVALLTGVVASDLIHRIALDTEGFRFASLKDYLHPQFLPGAVRYGDLPVLLGLNATSSIQVAGEASIDPIAKQCFEASHAGTFLEQVSKLNLGWLLEK